MRIETFEYDLPATSIAQHPASDRELARLLIVNGSNDFVHTAVANFPSHVPEGALVIVNDTRVIPARLLGHKADTGGKVEIFLLHKLEPREIEIEAKNSQIVDTWRAMGKASKGLAIGADVIISRGDKGGQKARLTVRILARSDDGLFDVALFSPNHDPIDVALQTLGHMPLPPYIKREDDEGDADRYQTVFAKNDGAVAAPTAGLHFTARLVAALALRNCDIAPVTLHVGLGTFQPVSVDDLDDHPMHAEYFEIPEATARAIANARSRNAPVVAIGTTVVRALESAADPDREGHVVACARETRMLIQPGYKFRIVDELFTNFHLPKSTLLALVCAFGGTANVLRAYETAVREGYRFFSYGDAMYLRRAS
jgi:S-adenosylmethionine:tRNA ribosyltransferase-isomerase